MEQVTRTGLNERILLLSIFVAVVAIDAVRDVLLTSPVILQYFVPPPVAADSS